MRKFMLLVAGLLITVAACKKENNTAEPTYEDRLTGTWDLKAVQYDGTTINPANPTQPLEVKGDGTNVLGVFELTQNPNHLKYSFSFNADVKLSDTSTQSVSVPISQSGEGDWTTTSDESKLIITDTSGTIYTFNVLVNEANKQVFKTNIQETVLGLIPVNADVTLEFSKR